MILRACASFPRLRNELLAAEARIDGHDEHQIYLVDHVVQQLSGVAGLNTSPASTGVAMC